MDEIISESWFARSCVGLLRATKKLPKSRIDTVSTSVKKRGEKKREKDRTRNELVSARIHSRSLRSHASSKKWAIARFNFYHAQQRPFYLFSHEQRFERETNNERSVDFLSAVINCCLLVHVFSYEQKP